MSQMWKNGGSRWNRQSSWVFVVQVWQRSGCGFNTAGPLRAKISWSVDNTLSRSDVCVCRCTVNTFFCIYICNFFDCDNCFILLWQTSAASFLWKSSVCWDENCQIPESKQSSPESYKTIYVFFVWLSNSGIHNIWNGWSWPKLFALGEFSFTQNEFVFKWICFLDSWHCISSDSLNWH